MFHYLLHKRFVAGFTAHDKDMHFVILYCIIYTCRIQTSAYCVMCFSRTACERYLQSMACEWQSPFWPSSIRDIKYVGNNSIYVLMLQSPSEPFPATHLQPISLHLSSGCIGTGRWLPWAKVSHENETTWMRSLAPWTWTLDSQLLVLQLPKSID